MKALEQDRPGCSVPEPSLNTIPDRVLTAGPDGTPDALMWPPQPTRSPHLPTVFITIVRAAARTQSSPSDPGTRSGRLLIVDSRHSSGVVRQAGHLGAEDAAPGLLSDTGSVDGQPGP